MIHPLSRATSYLQSFCVLFDGRHVLRSHATGFFVRLKDSIALVTNWHVVSGLNPADPSKTVAPPPHYLKVTVVGRNRGLFELSIPLYCEDMKPRWFEHADGNAVDIALIDLPIELESHFEFVDINSAEDTDEIAKVIAKDVFILGYPFSKEDIESEFGGDALHHLPVWKRGSIASEPSIPLRGRIVLIDSLSRAGMSGAPVLVAEEHQVMQARNAQGGAFIEKVLLGGGLDAVMSFDPSNVEHVRVKKFRLLGVYSGTIGSTKMGEIALGKCWTVQTLIETLVKGVPGKMPFHTPEPNPHYDALLQQMALGEVVVRNAAGEISSRRSIMR